MQTILQLFFIFLVSSPMLLSGQQVPLYLQYRNQLSVLNPAGLFIEDMRENFNTNAGVSYQSQFSGVEEQPYNALLHYKRIWDNQPIMTGGYMVQDKAGAISYTSAYGNFAYFLGNRSYTLGIGISAGFVQKRIKLSEIRSYEGSSRDAVNQISPDFSAGISYVYDEKYYANFHIPQLFAPQAMSDFVSDKPIISLLNDRHYLLTIGAYLEAGRGETAFFEPSLLIAYVKKGIPPKIDFSFKYKIVDAFWFGAGVSSVKTLNAGAGVILGVDSQMKIGFTHTMLVGNELSYFGNSWDLNISYAWEQ